MFRKTNNNFEFFLVHPGGRFWRSKDLGAWSIPKGEFTNEKPEVAARREFFEETGITFSGDLIPLTPQKLKSTKIIYAFAGEGDFQPHKLMSNKTKFGWPEIDRGEWFDYETALKKINLGQSEFLIELLTKL